MRPILKYQIIILFLGLSWVSVSAQRYVVQNFNVAQGLSQSEVGSITQLPDGRLVIDTEAFGLDLFDGQSFQELGWVDDLDRMQVDLVKANDEGELMIFAPDRSVRTIGSQSFESKWSFDGPAPGRIYEALYLSKDSTYLLATDKGLCKLEKNTCSVIMSEFGRCFDVIFYHERIVIATDSGLVSYQPGDSVTISHLYKDHPTYKLLHTSQDHLLIGTSNGLATLNGAEWNEDTLLTDPLHHVTSLIEDLHGRIWIGTSGDGLYVKEAEGDYSHVDVNNGLSDDFIWTLFMDMDGNIWIGTSGHGIDLISQSSFKVISESEGLQSDIAYCFEEYDGAIWIGSVEGGVDIYSEDGLTALPFPKEIANLSVRSLLSEDSLMWIGTDDGLWKFEEGVLKNMTDTYGLRNLAVYDIMRANDGALWLACRGTRYFGSDGALIKLTAQEPFFFGEDEGLTDQGVYCIFESDNGDILVGTSSGVYRHVDGRFSFVAASDTEKSPMNVHCIEQGANNEIWIGARNGLWSLRGEKIFPVEEPEVEKVPIYFIFNEDRMTWVGTAGGLCVLFAPVDTLSGRYEVQLFTEKEGIVGTECNQNAFLKDSQGKYWFGTIGGAIHYDPDQGLPQITLPRLRFDRLELLDNSEAIDLSSDPDKIEPQTAIVLDHDQHTMRVFFEAISLLRPGMIRYSYRLTGVTNTDWSPFSRQDHIQLIQLSPGEYTVQIKAQDIGTGMITKAKTLQFELRPAFWQTVWFKVLMAIGIICLTVAVFLVRIRKVRKEEAERRSIELRATQFELSALRAQMNPHFLFNSLNSLNALVIKGEKRLATNYISKFARLIRAVLQNSRERLIPLQKELETLELYIHVELSRLSDKVDYRKEIQEGMALDYLHIPPLTLQPFVENAIWHGIRHLESRPGELLIRVTKDSEHVRIDIEDNGIGRKASADIAKWNPKWKQSLGTEITDRRLELMNEIHGDRYAVDIHDLYDHDGVAIGTKVSITIKP